MIRLLKRRRQHKAAVAYLTEVVRVIDLRTEAEHRADTAALRVKR